MKRSLNWERIIKTVKVIIEHFNEDTSFGIFNTRNILGDTMECLYNQDGISVEVAPYEGYFEVFGLTEEEFNEVKHYYTLLVKVLEYNREREEED